MSNLSTKTFNALAQALGPEGVSEATEIDGALGGNDILLPDAQILVGQATGKSSAVPMSGDATIADTGVVSVASVAGKRLVAGSSSVTGSTALNTGLVPIVPADQRAAVLADRTHALQEAS